MLLELPGYTLTTRIYEGSETVLYRGRRDADGAPVAIKVTRNEYPTGRELARLRREFALLRQIDDVPGVVHAYALERCGRSLALVMEDLGETSLHDLLAEQGRLDVEAALRIAASLADTLEALHGRDVIHKDVKPRNIMIDRSTSAPRLVDFGISTCLARETASAATPDALEGTLAYMSPEQTGRVNRAVDLRTDLYSLGVTLHEMLAGAPPFSAADPMELVHSHIARAPAPLHELSKGVPEALSDVVLRLLSKTPEERYQSARGLKADLEACLSQWTATGRIDPFPLGRQDRTGALRIPQKLYGREREVAALLSAFERVREGAPELILISGYSGVGKSALVNELHKPIAQRGGALVHGKFDPQSRDTPLAPVVDALRELVRQVLTEPPAALDAWRTALLDAVGRSGRLLTELLPELELVIGPQPEVPALGPAEARNRFDLVMRRFVLVFATAERPLVLFLDDLQWADPASLRLLGLLLGDKDRGHVLLVGAYRDNEVDGAHPLTSTLDELRKAGVAMTELTLRPLSPPTVTQILIETLHRDERDVEELSAVIFEKTQGNPFFLSQFLDALHEAQSLWFDAGTGAFRWDLARVRGALATDNVIDLVLSKLHRLAPGTQRALSLAACIGHELDLPALSVIHGKPPAETAADLWEALREGLLVPQGGDYRLLDANHGVEPGSDVVDLDISYRFLHDRVREAAYRLIPDERKEEVHLSIGRLLWARSGEPPADRDVLEIVRHLRLSARGITDPAERLAAARLDLRAGRTAKARAAYGAAADHFTAGLERLGEGGWERDAALSFDLHIEAAECLFLSGRTEQAEPLLDALLQRAPSRLERARVHRLRVILYSTVTNFSGAVRAGLAGLECLGVPLPATSDEQKAAFGRELEQAAAALQGRRVEDLIDAPEMDDPEQRAVLQLFIDVISPMMHVELDLFLLSVLRLVNLSLTHGHCDLSAYGYMAYGYLLSLYLGRPDEGHAFGKLSLALNEKFPNQALSVKLATSLGIYWHLREPIRAAIALLDDGRKAALECGDHEKLVENCHLTIAFKLLSGYPLDEIEGEIERFLTLLQRTRSARPLADLTVAYKQGVACLKGRTQKRTCLSDGSFDEDAYRARLAEEERPTVVFDFHLVKLLLHVLHGEHGAAGAHIEALDGVTVFASGSYLAAARLQFYACLSLLSLPPAETPGEAERRGSSLARRKARLAEFAAGCPANFQHLSLLVEAEEARRAGKHDEAAGLFDRAITLARESDARHDEALANERCAMMYLALGRPKAARGYLSDAYHGYLHWGALAKAEELERAHGDALLLPAAGGRRATTSRSSASTTTMNTTLLGHTLMGNLRDAALIVQAARIIAQESDLPKVIERLAKIVLESAGAERGALLLDRDEQLFVEATFGVSPERLRVGPSAPLDASAGLARSVALLVARTREPLVLDDARDDRRFAADPHVAADAVQSVLCLPLLYQDRLTGVLYLENNRVSAAFDAARVELLQLVSSQAAIAIENARRVAEIRAANARVRRVNERLEAEIAQRTEELRVANGELTAANERLRLELVQREEAESARAALQQQMFEAQQVRLAEMSTPFIPITDQIMVMPLIGTVDAERAAQVLEAALRGAEQRGARVVILDVTGIRRMDITVVRTLLGCAAALRLLGTQAVLTGIRPEVARTMVELGTDLTAIVTRGTLQSGIAHALRLTGELVGHGPSAPRSGAPGPRSAPAG
ncbi:AAA family ATPase [Sorangium sp. So ce1036]|uniref:AAA family ATPase n=1 Tax=Sorangium sp. So ce1036 TaxID=3133328 RepID=UPI003F080489